MTGKKSFLVTHSQGGRARWDTSIYTSHIAAIVAIVPGFRPTVGSNGYNALVSNKIPIVFYYGDYIGGSYNGNIPASSM